jgi:hypothetical protein
VRAVANFELVPDELLQNGWVLVDRAVEYVDEERVQPTNSDLDS